MDPNTLIFSAPEHCVSNLLCCLAPQWYSKIPHIAYNHLYFNNRSTVWESSDPVFIMALFCFHRESLKLYHLMPRTTSLHAQRRPWNVWSLLSYPEHLFSVMPRCSFKFCQFTPSIPPLPIFPCLLPDTYTQPLSSPALSWKTADPLHSIWLFSLLLPMLPRWDFLKKCITHYTAHSAICIPTLSHRMVSLLWNTPIALFVTAPIVELPSSSANPVFILVFGAFSHLSEILLPSFWYYSMPAPDLVTWFLLGCFVLLDINALVRTSPSTLRLVIPWEVFHPSLVMGTSPFRGIFKRL